MKKGRLTHYFYPAIIPYQERKSTLVYVCFVMPLFVVCLTTLPVTRAIVSNERMIDNGVENVPTGPVSGVPVGKGGPQTCTILLFGHLIVLHTLQSVYQLPSTQVILLYYVNMRLDVSAIAWSFSGSLNT